MEMADLADAGQIAELACRKYDRQRRQISVILVAVREDGIRIGIEERAKHPRDRSSSSRGSSCCDFAGAIDATIEKERKGKGKQTRDEKRQREGQKRKERTFKRSGGGNFKRNTFPA